MYMTAKTGSAVKRWIAMSSVILLAGCTGYESSISIEGVTYWINGSGRNAFAAECEWDMSEEPSEIVIRETAEGAKVTSLGGFFGTGVPAPFEIHAKEADYTYSEWEVRGSEYGLPVIAEDVPVTVYLPSGIKEIKNSHSAMYYGNTTEDGTNLFLKPQIIVECDEENDTYYSENGTLYQKSDSAVVDLNSESDGNGATVTMTLRDRLLGRYIRETEEDIEVYDFFDAFGTVYAHINYYMEGDEYMFAATEYTPVNAADLERTDIDSFDATSRHFSDFSNAGQYVDVEDPHCSITVTEEGIRIDMAYASLELKRDYSMPSQFPFDASSMHNERPGNESVYRLSMHSLEPLVLHTLECDEYRMKIYRDGTMILVMKNAETPTILRGTAEVFGDGTQIYKMRYALVKTGGTTEPKEGVVLVSFDEADCTVAFSPYEDYYGGVLLNDESETVKLNNAE